MADDPIKPQNVGGLAVKGVAAISIAIVASLAMWEGDRNKPYQDQVGVWTVCRGITGPAVIPGKIYTAIECNKLEADYLAKMLAKMDKCITEPLTFDEWVAYGHFTYNIGTEGFCKSTLVKKLNSGDRKGACLAMGSWTYIRKNGVLVNCRDPKHKCGGVPKRRDYEVKMCLDALG